MTVITKALSFDERSTLVRRTFYALIRPEDDYFLDVMDVYDDYAIVCIQPARYYEVPYTFEGAEVVIAPPDEWKSVEKEWVAVKAGFITTTRVKAVKGTGQWTLDVLGNPYGDSKNLDRDGQYFDKTTQFHFDKHALPPVVTHHGLNPQTGEWDKPAEYIGKAVSYEERPDGIWYRVVLDKANDLAKKIWDNAQKGMVYASTGSMPQFARVAKDGHVDEWPVGELSLIDLSDNFLRPKNSYAVALPAMKAIYEAAGMTLPPFLLDDDGGGAVSASVKGEQQSTPDEPTRPVTQEETPNNHEDNEMAIEEKQVQDLIAAALKAQRDADKAEAVEAARIKTENDALIKAEVDKQMADEKVKSDAKLAAFAKANRLPFSADDGGIPVVAKFGEIWKYDNLDAADNALAVSVLRDAKKRGISDYGASPAMMKAAAIKLLEDKERIGVVGRQEMIKAQLPMKADEIMQQDLTGFGDEWVGIAFSQAIWDAIRIGTFVASRLPSIEVPPGHESIYLPLEGADPTYYKVAEATAMGSTLAAPAPTIASSQLATARVQLTLAKMGARVIWSGELEEDSLVPFVSQLRNQLTVAGVEQLEHVIIDGDTAAGATTNINDIGGTPGGTELFLLFNGFRKSPLVTTTANSRDGGVLTVEDFMETVKLMGAAGTNAIDIAKVSFILDMQTNWKAIQLPEVKTKDVNTQATVENGKLRNIWGYAVDVSAQMHRGSAVRLANAAGKIDENTPSNNTTGSLLAVRWDQWLLGYRRRMTIETTRFASSDATEIVALARLGLIQRDTEASAISYNLTV